MRNVRFKYSNKWYPYISNRQEFNLRILRQIFHKAFDRLMAPSYIVPENHINKKTSVLYIKIGSFKN